MKTDLASHNDKIQAIRAQFPLLQNTMNGKPLIFLDTAASSQKPRSVIDAMKCYYEQSHANVHRGVYQLSQVATDQFEKAREKVKSFVNANHSHEIIFTKGATESINLVASSFGRKYLSAGDEVLISAMEHHSNIVPWQMICQERGATLKVIPIDATGTLDMDAYKKMLNRNTKIVAITHVSNTLGTINPIKEIVAEAHKNNTPILVDGAQASLHMRVDVQDLDADFYVFSGHKIYGPTGIGVLYGKEALLNDMPPYQGGGEMISEVTFERSSYNTLPFKFEAGTPSIAEAIGIGVAIDFINEIGHEFITLHEEELLQYATAQLSKIEGLKIIGTAAKKASLISFVIEGLHPLDIGSILDKMGIAVRTGHHCTQPLMRLYDIPGTVRASFGVYTTKDDIDALEVGIKKAIDMLS